MQTFVGLVIVLEQMTLDVIPNLKIFATLLRAVCLTVGTLSLWTILTVADVNSDYFSLMVF